MSEYPDSKEMLEFLGALNIYLDELDKALSKLNTASKELGEAILGFGQFLEAKMAGWKEKLN